MTQRRITAEEFQAEVDNLGLGPGDDGLGVTLRQEGEVIFASVSWPDGIVTEASWRALTWDDANNLLARWLGEWDQRNGDEGKNGGGKL